MHIRVNELVSTIHIVGTNYTCNNTLTDAQSVREKYLVLIIFLQFSVEPNNVIYYL